MTSSQEPGARPGPPQDPRPWESLSEEPRISGSSQGLPPPQAWQGPQPAYVYSASQVWVGTTGTGRPPVVTAAFWLGIGDVVVAFALLAVKFFASDELMLRLLGNADFLLTAADFRNVYYGVLTGLLALAVLLSSFWVLFLFFLRRGRRWARVVITAVGFVWAVSTLLSLVGKHPGGPLPVALEVVQVALLVATLVCLHAGGSIRDFFTNYG